MKGAGARRISDARDGDEGGVSAVHARLVRDDHDVGARAARGFGTRSRKAQGLPVDTSMGTPPSLSPVTSCLSPDAIIYVSDWSPRLANIPR